MTSSSDNQPGNQDHGLPPMVSIAGFSDSGKTTLIERLIPGLRRLGITVGTVKHDVHGFDIDQPGKDSYRHKQAGAAVTLISSPQRIGMVMDVDHDYGLEELRNFFDTVDIILAEGYKHANVPKLEVFRRELHKDPVCKGDNQLLALITHSPVDLGVPSFSPNDNEGLARFIMDVFGLGRDGTTENKHAESRRGAIRAG